MINFLKKLHLHPLLLFVMVLSFITGTFELLLTLFTIILIHEVGHYVMATHFRWHIQSIVLWIFGGVMHTTESTNRPIREDILVTIAGPLQHLWIGGAIYILSHTALIPVSIIETAYHFNWLLLAFNLLPIYPLDGGKLLFYSLCIRLPYKKAHQYTYRFSLMASGCLIVSLLYYPFTLTAFLLLLFLAWENIRQWQQHPYIFMRFLLHRSTEKKINLLTVNEDTTLIDIFALFRRNRYHHLKLEKHTVVITESTALAYYFKANHIQKTLNDLLKLP